MLSATNTTNSTTFQRHLLLLTILGFLFCNRSIAVVAATTDDDNQSCINATQNVLYTGSNKNQELITLEAQRQVEQSKHNTDVTECIASALIDDGNPDCTIDYTKSNFYESYINACRNAGGIVYLLNSTAICNIHNDTTTTTTELVNATSDILYLGGMNSPVCLLPFSKEYPACDSNFIVADYQSKIQETLPRSDTGLYQCQFISTDVHIYGDTTTPNKDENGNRVSSHAPPPPFKKANRSYICLLFTLFFCAIGF